MSSFTKRGLMSAFLLLLTLVGARAQEFVVDGVRYSVAYAYPSGEPVISVSGCEDVAGELVIPPTVVFEGEEYEVTGIDYWYDSSCGAELTSITIPSTVLSIDFRSFAECPKLRVINIDEQHPWYSSVDGVLYDKEQTKLVFVPNGLEEIRIPSSVSSIEGVTDSSSFLAFSDYSQLQYIQVDEQNPYFSSIDGVLYNKEQTVLWNMPKKKPTTDFVVPSSVTHIGKYAFCGCVNLMSIELPSSLTCIDTLAFAGCTGLASIEIPASVTSIDCGAFANCASLISIEIPSSVTSISDYTFQNCTGLTSIEIPVSITCIGNYAFTNCTSLTSIRIPASVTSIGNGAFSDCAGLTSIEIPASVTSIADVAFMHCTSLTSIEIPASITNIGGNAFAHCTNLTSIEIPASVTSIGYGAFSGCTGLTSIEIPSTVITIDDYAFYKCTSLASVAFEAPSSLETIGDGAFYDCNLTTMAIPPSAKEIGSQAFDFYSGHSLDTIVIPHSIESMGDPLGYERPQDCLQTFIVLNSNDDVIDALSPLFNLSGFTQPLCLSTVEILEQIPFARNKITLYTVSDARNTGGTLSLSLTDIADEVLQIRALEIGGQRVEANESSAYTFENVGEGTEFELVVYADILDTEYPIYQTITVEKGEVGIGDVKTAGAGLPEVRGNLAEGQAWVRIPGDGGTAEWTLTATDGTTVAQGRAQADGNWQPLEGAQAAKGLYLLTVRCGQTAKTVKFMAQ